MTTRADVNQLTAAQRRLVTMAQGELAAFFGTLDLSRPDAVRDALIEIVPLMVREYGDLAAVAAAEWYEQVRPAAGFLAQTANPVAEAQVRQSTRFNAGHLFGDDPAATLSGVQGAMQRFVTYSGRATIARNAALDPQKPLVARVPSGPKTCAWCGMLASRGFVYHSKRAAGATDDFHDDCDCQMVVEFDRNQAHIDGYDPDHLFDRYQQARDAANSSDPKEIAAQMRRMFPDEFTDGHAHA